MRPATRQTNPILAITPNEKEPMSFLESLKRTCSVDEYFDKLCKKVGHLYGLNDIREA